MRRDERSGLIVLESIADLDYIQDALVDAFGRPTLAECDLPAVIDMSNALGDAHFIASMGPDQNVGLRLDSGQQALATVALLYRQEYCGDPRARAHLVAINGFRRATHLRAVD